MLGSCHQRGSGHNSQCNQRHGVKLSICAPRMSANGCYPGFRIPQPLEVTENWGSLSFRDVAEDLLRSTKLNWNTAAFCCIDPITIAFSRRVGDILKMANTENPARHYRYYM